MCYAAALHLYRIKIRYQINTVPTPTVAITRAQLLQRGGGVLHHSTLQHCLTALYHSSAPKHPMGTGAMIGSPPAPSQRPYPLLWPLALPSAPWSRPAAPPSRSSVSKGWARSELGHHTLLLMPLPVLLARIALEVGRGLRFGSCFSTGCTRQNVLKTAFPTAGNRFCNLF